MSWQEAGGKTTPSKFYSICGWKSPILRNLGAKLKCWTPLISSAGNLHLSVEKFSNFLPHPNFVTHDRAADLLQNFTVCCTTNP